MPYLSFQMIQSNSNMNISYKFFSIDPEELKHEAGRYPMDNVFPFGPEHPDAIAADKWLSEHFEPGNKYTLLPIYTA